MTTDVLEKPQLADTCPDDLVCIESCAQPGRALCGRDVTGDYYVDNDVPTTCVVCRDLDEAGLCCAEIPTAGQ